MISISSCRQRYEKQKQQIKSSTLRTRESQSPHLLPDEAVRNGHCSRAGVGRMEYGWRHPCISLLQILALANHTEPTGTTGSIRTTFRDGKDPKSITGQLDRLLRPAETAQQVTEIGSSSWVSGQRMGPGRDKNGMQYWEKKQY